MKNERLAKILALIASEDIGSQEELAKRLNEQGMSVTQATVSRDIKDLKLIKIRTDSGGFKYVADVSLIPSKDSGAPNQEVTQTEARKKPVNDSRFSVKDGVLLKYLGADADVVIPDYVTEIAKNAFYRKTTPVTITIPATVKVLQPYALAECKSLEKLVIEPGRAVIPEQFCNCCRNLKEVILPEGITEIGERAFHACRLFHIVLPDSLKVIGDDAFWETPLLEISLPDGIESVGHGAFQGSAVSEIIIPGSCRHIGDDVCTPENLKTMVICSDDILPKPFSWQKNANDKFSTNFLFHSFLDEKDKMNPKATIYCSPAVKKRMPKCWSGKIRPLSEWTGKGGASQADVKTDEKFPVYRLPDEIIRRLFLGDADPVEVLDKKKFPRKSMMSVETASGTVEVVNRAYPDIKNLKNYFGLWPGGYDMYDAMDYYLPKEEVASRINIFDRGHSDAAYFAKPEIDWKAPELTKTQAATRILFLTAVVDRCLDSDVLKQIIASVPKKKDGTFVKNRVTRIASGNIVSQDAQVLEFAAKADSDKSLTLYVDYRPFSGEELAIIESDFLSTHFSIMKRDLAPEAVREAVIASGYPSRQKAIRELRKAYLTGEDEWTAVWKKRFGEDPVFRSLATSLVWILREQLNDKCTFMVKKDGLCVSSDGTELVLPDHFKIAVAYGPHLEDEELAKWKTVFAAEGIDQLFMQLDETRYDGFALEVTDSPKHDYKFYHSPSGEKIVTRYDGVDVWYGNLKECLADGYEYEAYPDQQEKIHFPLKTAFMWAPMDGSNTFYPYEDLVFDKEIHLGEWFLPGYDAEYSVLPRSINHFLFMMDKACLKDAIRRHDLSLLKGRSKFLSPANIAECIELAKEQDAADCLAWLEEQANNRR